ncbi:MAG: hypothetical protein ACREUF_04245 [Solimonas sp.]
MLVVQHTGALAAWQIGAVAFGISALRTIEAPVLSAQLPLLVPRRHLMAINGVLDNTKRVARLIAPVLIAACQDLLSVGQLFGLVALAYWCMAAAAGLIADARPVSSTKSASPSSFTSWRDTWDEARRDRELFCAILFSGAYTVAHGASYWVLIPRLLLDHLSLGTAGLALVIAGFGAGGLLGNLALLTSRYSGQVSLVGLGMAMASTAFFSFAFVGSEWTAVIAAVLGGLALPMMDVSMQVLIHQRAARDHWGRIFALWRYVAEVGIGIGLLIGGPIAELIGAAPGLVGLGLYGIMVGLILLLAARRFVPVR